MSLKTLIAYQYDAFDRLSRLVTPGQTHSSRFYTDDTLSSQIQGQENTVFFNHEDQRFGYSKRTGDTVRTTLVSANQQGTPLHALSTNERKEFEYTPYGYCSDTDEHLGFNGEQPDPVTGCYLLGNGYRAYNPVLMRFHSPDSMSPFGAGGVNPYAYCVGDPINLTDPTGHFSFKSIFRIFVAVASIAIAAATLAIVPFSAPVAFAAIADIASNVLGIGSEIVKNLAPESRTGDALDRFSMGFGAVSFVLGRGLLSKSKVLSPTKLVRRNLSNIANTRIIKNASEVSQFYKSARKSLKAVSYLDQASDAVSGLKYAKYAMTGLDVTREYVIPYLSPPNSGEGEDWRPQGDENTNREASLREREGNVRDLL